MTFLTTQLDSVDADAGLQQNINVDDTPASIFPDQSGTGWAGTVTPSTTSTTFTTSNLPFYFAVLALAWFAYKRYGG